MEWLTQLMRDYGAADELIYARLAGASGSTSAAAGRAGRELARSVRARFQSSEVAEIAESYGIGMVCERWPLAFGSVIYLAEATLKPARIRLNQTAVEAVVRASGGQEGGWWFGAKAVTETALAHELYHLLARRPSQLGVELAAHAFARELVGLPFSPLLYAALLVRSSDSCSGGKFTERRLRSSDSYGLFSRC